MSSNYFITINQEFLEEDKSVSIHSRDLQTLGIKMFKVSKGICPIIALFNARPNYNLRQYTEFSTLLVNCSVYNGTESISFLGLKLWDMVPM